MNDKRRRSVDTLLVHAGEPRPRICGAVAMPVFMSSTYETGADGDPNVRYLRYNNAPSHTSLQEKIAALEGGESAVVAATGMAAVSNTLLSILGQGDHLLAHRALYGGTLALALHELPRLGIECTLVDAGDPETWKDALRPTTRAFFVESMTNPLLEVVALEEVAAFSKAHGLTSVVDNTFATPINFRPIELGFDVVVHSATKYLNGHSDIVAGAVVGSATVIAEVSRKLARFGGTLDPHACFLLQRGLKTLALRVRHQNESGVRLARVLADHRAIEGVHYPGLDSDPGFERASKWFSGCGGVLAFEIKGGAAAADAFFERCVLPTCAPSLGGAETLMTRPSATSHAGLPPDERRRQGISDGLVRVSVGLESPDDLIEDIQRALSSGRV